MKTASELLAELNELDEHVSIEAKTAADVGKSLLETVCAYSNEPNLGGGYILLGVASAVDSLWPLYEAVGVGDPDRLQNDIASQCATMFNVPIRPRIASEKIGTKNVITMFVPEAGPQEKPIHFKNQPLPGSAFRRIGSTDQHCTDDDLVVFYQDRRGETFDEQIVADAEVSDFDADAIEQYRQLRREVNPDAEELRWSDQELLEALGAVRKHQSQFRPTIAGLLLFGTAKALRQFFPMMRIDYIRVPGVQWVKDPDRRFDTVEIRSPLIRAIQRARAAILDDLPKAFSLPAGEVQGQEIPVLPDRVVREVVANAVMHRSYRSHGSIQIIRYANRLEIRNPGYSLKAEERLGEPGSETRNPKIAAVLHEIKFAETKGSGIRVMRELMAECNLSPPVFQSDRTGNSFLAILLFHHFLSREDLDWLATFQEHGLAEDEMKALISAREVGAIDNSSYRDINRGVDTLTASKHLKRLCQFDLLRKKGQGSGTYYVPTEKLLASWNEVSTRETASESPELAEKPSGFGDKSSGLAEKPSGFGDKSSGLAEKPSELDSPEIRSTGETSKDSVIENSLPPELAAEIADLGGWAKKEQIRELVLKICSWRDLSLPDLSRLLGRSEGHLRQVIISPMVKEGLLQFTIPDEPSHPRQRYRTAPKPPTVVDEGR